MNSTAQLKGKVVRVTPTLAKDWLKTVAKQRPLHSATVDNYVHQMREGQWALTGEPLIFSTKGALLNGQHQLHAVIKSGKTVDVFVVRGVEESAFDVMDTGRSRKAYDVLGIAGESYTHSLASALGAIYRLEHFGMASLPKQRGRERASNRDIEETLKRHPGIRSSLQMGHEIWPYLGSAGMGVTLHYLMSQKDKELADTFFGQLQSGEGLRQRDPAYQLREYLINQRDKRTKAPLVDRVFVFVKAWNLARAGKPASKPAITWYASKDEPAPEIE